MPQDGDGHSIPRSSMGFSWVMPACRTKRYHQPAQPHDRRLALRQGTAFVADEVFRRHWPLVQLRFWWIAPFYRDQPRLSAGPGYRIAFAHLSDPLERQLRRCGLERESQAGPFWCKAAEEGAGQQVIRCASGLPSAMAAARPCFRAFCEAPLFCGAAVSLASSVPSLVVLGSSIAGQVTRRRWSGRRPRATRRRVISFEAAAAPGLGLLLQTEEFGDAADLLPEGGSGQLFAGQPRPGPGRDRDRLRPPHVREPANVTVSSTHSVSEAFSWALNSFATFGTMAPATLGNLARTASAK